MELNSESVEKLFSNLGLTNNLIYALIIVLVLNIGVIILKFYLDIRLKDREQLVHRRNLISSRAVELHEDIFSRMEKLSLYTRGEEDLLLKDLQDLQFIISTKRLHLSKGMMVTINNIMDYFKTLLIDYRLKDVNKERKCIDEYIQKFHN